MEFVVVAGDGEANSSLISFNGCSSAFCILSRASLRLLCAMEKGRWGMVVRPADCPPTVDMKERRIHRWQF